MLVTCHVDRVSEPWDGLQNHKQIITLITAIIDPLASMAPKSGHFWWKNPSNMFSTKSWQFWGMRRDLQCNKTDHKLDNRRSSKYNNIHSKTQQQNTTSIAIYHIYVNPQQYTSIHNNIRQSTAMYINIGLHSNNHVLVENNYFFINFFQW